jgi:hypothetical protein
MKAKVKEILRACGKEALRSWNNGSFFFCYVKRKLEIFFPGIGYV